MSEFNQREQQVDTQYNSAGGIYFCHRAASGKPLQRPPRAIPFTGRKAEMEQLLEDLQPGRIITLCGPGGIGKSALAAETLWQLAPGDELPDRFVDGIVFHSFYWQPDTDIALESIARAFGEEPKPSPASAAQRALAGKRALLVLDGTEDADDLLKIQAVAGGCAMLVTSRRKRDALAKRTDIAPLEVGEAVELLRAVGSGQVDDDAAARRIAQLIGGLPLAVRLAGRYLDQTGETATEYLQWLTATPLEALDPDQGRHRMESVPLLLQRSLQQLSGESQDVLSLAGRLALIPFGQDMIRDALQLSTSTVKRAFRELTDFGLLLRAESGRYEISHALIHTYASKRLHVEDMALARLVAYANVLVEAESRKGLEGYNRLDLERPHLLQLLDSCVDRGEWKEAEDLAWSMDDYLDVRGYRKERLIVDETGLQATCELERSKARLVTWMVRLGIAYNDLGQVHRAIGFFEQALSIARETGIRGGESALLGNLGIVYRVLGQQQKAIGFFEQALAIDREIRNRDGEGSHLSNLGIAYNDLGQVHRAIGFFEQALSIAREIGDRRGEGSHLGNLGIAYRDLGEEQKAIGFFEQALSIAREIGDWRLEKDSLGNLGTIYFELNQEQKAIGFFEQALAIAREIGDRDDQGARLGSLGIAYLKLGQEQKAIGFFEQALAISREIGDRDGQGARLGNLGIAYLELGQEQKAIGFFEQALSIAREIGDRRGEGAQLGNLGIAYRDLGEEQKARRSWKESLAVCEKIKSPHEQLVRQLLRDLGSD